MSRRSLTLVLALTTMLAACGGGGDGDDEKAEQTQPQQTTRPKPVPRCPARLTLDGVDYVGREVRLPAEAGQTLGRGTIPPCGAKGKRRKIALAEIRGVDPGVAVGEPEDAFTVWVAKSARPQSYPATLERILFGPSCNQTRPFTLAGQWRGVSSSSQPLTVQLDATQTTGAGRAYQGGVIELVVQESTKGLNSPADFANLERGTASIRARVRCVEADRPNRTFLAESIVSTTG